VRDDNEPLFVVDFDPEFLPDAGKVTLVDGHVWLRVRVSY